ncbi:YbdD/YjiX family protein [Candidatus Korobacter versatilis]|uniref:YbdD/YjiX family protein n=1 Tax=Candidatus Korobacter versatilis TaxID=658062 RepID=UPI0002D43001|nr:YbdD/YjiX family protein [Candidatus Koribacter versatilis]
MKALRLIWAALREIFDEAAYDRFLRSHQLANSAESYAHFQRDRRASQERRPRCC